MTRNFLAVVALLAVSGVGHADDNNCEAIRTLIDTKVRASGVSDFALSVVAADAQVGGRVVGSCDLGTKKIMYDKASSPILAPEQPKANQILTECRDGSVSLGGDCKT